MKQLKNKNKQAQKGFKTLSGIEGAKRIFLVYRILSFISFWTSYGNSLLLFGIPFGILFKICWKFFWIQIYLMTGDKIDH